jgi:hypothetical protein
MESSYGQDFHFAILASIDYISKRVRWRRFLMLSIPSGAGGPEEVISNYSKRKCGLSCMPCRDRPGPL